MTRTRRVTTAAATGLLGAALLSGGFAQADAIPGPAGLPGSSQGSAAAPAKPYGTVLSTSGVNIRNHPTTNSAVTGHLKYKQKVGIACKTTSQNVGGNRIWYKLRGYDHNWVSARYVKNTGQARQCKVTRAELAATANAVPPKG